MADAGDSRRDDTARLEAALARIARARPAPVAGGELAERLDSLIADLRAVLKD